TAWLGGPWEYPSRLFWQQRHQVVEVPCLGGVIDEGPDALQYNMASKTRSSSKDGPTESAKKRLLVPNVVTK
ncbi:hypothetical protein M378DRAFT_162228, partial [Amanita muscaria Koide BX008]